MMEDFVGHFKFIYRIKKSHEIRFIALLVENGEQNGSFLNKSILQEKMGSL